MCNSTLSLSRSVEEIYQDIKKSVKSFFDSDDVKKMYADYLDAIVAEAKEECIASNTPIKSDIEVAKEKDLFYEYHLSVGFLSYMEGNAKLFDSFLQNPNNLPSEQIESAMHKCLEHEHMLTALEKILSNSEQRERLKIIFACLIQKR